MMRILALAMLLACTVPVPVAAEDLTVRDFLATARYDEVLARENEKLDFLQAASGNTPYLDRIEFRTATDEFRATNETYRLRFYPAGWGETRAGENLFAVTVERTEAQRTLALHQALKTRYQAVVDYLHAKESLALHQKLVQIQEDRITVLRSSVNTIDFDIMDLLEAEDDYLRLQRDIPALEEGLCASESLVRRHAGSQRAIGFDAEGIVAVEEMLAAVRSLDAAVSDQETIYLQESRLRVEEEHFRYDLEKARSRRFLSFLETSYDNKNRDHAREAYSVEMGIELPFISSDRLDIHRRKLDYLTEQGRHDDLKRSLGENLAHRKEEFERLVDYYHRMIADTRRGPSAASLLSYQQVDGADPLILLKIRENMLRRDVAVSALAYEIRCRYVDILDLSGLLSRQPLRNLLSAAHEELPS